MKGDIRIDSTWRGPSINIPPKVSELQGGLYVLQAEANSLDAPGLTTVGGTCQSCTGGGNIVINGTKLNHVGFTELKTIIGDLVVAGNDNLRTINGFPQLGSIIGNIEIVGPIDTSSFPSLNNITQGINIQSSSNNFTCPVSDFSTSNGGVAGQDFVCQGNIPNPKLARPVPTPTAMSVTTLVPVTNVPGSGASRMVSSGIFPLRSMNPN